MMRPGPWMWATVAVALIALFVLTRPERTARPVASGPPVPFAVARDIVDQRCRSCHSARPSDMTFPAAPNGVAFDTADSVVMRAAAIRERTVVLRNMPLANKTGMTDEERELLGRWVDQGARTQ